MQRKPTYEELEQRVRELEEATRELRATREALRNSEERYRLLADFTYDLETWRGPDGRYLYVSPSCERVTGYRYQEFLKDPWLVEKIVHPEDRDRVVRHFRRDFGEGGVRHVDFRIRTRDGEERWISHYCQPVYGRDGAWLGRRCSNRDFTGRKATETALRESDARHRAVVEAFDGLIYVCSRDYRVEFMNPRLIERTGRDATGELCYKALHDLDEVCPWCVNDRVFRGETVRWEVKSPKDDRWFYIVNTPIHHVDGSVSKQAMILDVTEQKRAVEALEKSAENLKLFAYSVSHDLKSPAVGIYGLARRLRNTCWDELGEKGRACCDQIQKAAEHVSDLVSQINVYISTKSEPLRVERLDPAEVLAMIRDEFSGRMALRGVRWSEPEDPPEIRADRIGLLRIVRNLVDNALKYGGEDLNEIRVDCGASDAHHWISVSNDGAVIRREHAGRIFGPFQRHDPAGGVEGVGLGLAIVKQIAEQHGGTVWAEATGGKWTTFHVTLAKVPPGEG